MPKEITRPKCGENMEEIRRKIAAGAGSAEPASKYPPEEIHFKYKCSNRECSNYGEEFYEDEL